MPSVPPAASDPAESLRSKLRLVSCGSATPPIEAAVVTLDPLTDPKMAQPTILVCSSSPGQSGDQHSKASVYVVAKPAGAQNLRHQDEERHTREYEAVGASPADQAKAVECGKSALKQQIDESGNADRKRHRHPDRQQDQEDDEDDKDLEFGAHRAAPPDWPRSIRIRARIVRQIE